MASRSERRIERTCPKLPAPVGSSGPRYASFTVTLSAASDRTITLNYATANGTAVAGSDYTATSGTLSFAPGETVKTFSVGILGDTRDEDHETFLVNLSSPSHVYIGDGQAVGTIIDNDPTPTLRIADVGITEGVAGSKMASFTVTLSSASGRPVSVAYSTADGTARNPAFSKSTALQPENLEGILSHQAASPGPPLMISIGLMRKESSTAFFNH